MMFTLNVVRGAGFTAKKVTEAAPLPLQILMVEDDEADAHLIRRLLSEHPRIVNVIRAVDGVEALQMLQAGVNPDLAFIDLQMPRMNGFTLVSEIEARRLGFPMIVLTSQGAPSETVRRRLRPARQILSKPDTVSQMRSVIATAIERVAA
jgi:CheY-like chemotaxis protein